MSDATPIHVPRENVNDESVALVAWLVADGHAVHAGQAVAEIETSKAAAEIPAPVAGTLRHARKVGEEIEIGGLLGHVAQDASATIPVPASPGGPAPELAAVAQVGHRALPTFVDLPQLDRPAYASRTTRISPVARRLMEQRGVDPEQFTGRGLIRVQDVLELLGEAPAAQSPATQSPTAAAKASPAAVSCVGPVGAMQPVVGVPVRTEPLPRSKKTEAKYLLAGLYGTLPSVITVACPTRGLRAASRSQPSLRGQATALVVYEAARLLQSYPAFNACHSDGTAHYYEQVNIGFALDAGNGLKVPVVRNADTKSISQIADEMQELLVQYLDNKLRFESLAGATFTISDLSGEGVFAFHPLISQGQSAILGIGGEFFAPGGGEGLFNLILAFDHQLSEGRQAARFLNELKARVAGYEQAMGGAAAMAEELYCSQCLTPIHQLLKEDYHMLQMLTPQGAAKPICSRCVLGQW